MSDRKELETIKRSSSLTIRFAEKYGVDPNKILSTLKATVFKQKNGEVSNEQMMALLIVADQYGLNPFTKEIYAFPDSGGIVPVVGVDGWSRIANEHLQYDGVEFSYSENIVTLKDAKPCPEWIDVTIHRTDRSHPTTIREYLDEVYVPKRGSYAGPWQTHTKRQLRHKGFIQASRIALSFTGIYDEDEAIRITEKDITNFAGENIKTEIKQPQSKKEAKAKTKKETVKKPEEPKKEEPISSGNINKEQLTKVIRAIQNSTVTENEVILHFNLQQLETMQVNRLDEIILWIIDPVTGPE